MATNPSALNLIGVGTTRDWNIETQQRLCIYNAVQQLKLIKSCPGQNCEVGNAEQQKDTGRPNGHYDMPNPRNMYLCCKAHYCRLGLNPAEYCFACSTLLILCEVIKYDHHERESRLQSVTARTILLMPWSNRTATISAIHATPTNTRARSLNRL